MAVDCQDWCASQGPGLDGTGAKIGPRLTYLASRLRAWYSALTRIQYCEVIGVSMADGKRNMGGEERVGIVASKFVPANPISALSIGPPYRKMESGWSAKQSPYRASRVREIHACFAVVRGAADEGLILRMAQILDVSGLCTRTISGLYINAFRCGKRVANWASSKAAARNELPIPGAVVLSKLMRRIGNWPCRCVLILDGTALAASC